MGSKIEAGTLHSPPLEALSRVVYVVPASEHTATCRPVIFRAAVLYVQSLWLITLQYSDATYIASQQNKYSQLPEH